MAGDTIGCRKKMGREKTIGCQKKWLAIRKRAARKIDPETAEVVCMFAYDFDPYGIDPELPEEFQQVGRHCFVRSPGSDVWVWDCDLPSATAHALWPPKSSDFLDFLPEDEPPTKYKAPPGVSRRDDNDGGWVVPITEEMLRQAVEFAERMEPLRKQIQYPRSGDACI